MSTGREPADRPMTNRARKALAEAQRWRTRQEEAEERAVVAEREVAAIWQKTCERFGREVPADAFLLDVLDGIDVEEGDRWIWRGSRNNKRLAVVRCRRQGVSSEESVPRYLAVAFGIIDPDEWGIFYPVNGDTEDVNPWHRKLRRSPVPVSNPNRFAFTPAKADQ